MTRMIARFFFRVFAFCLWGLSLVLAVPAILVLSRRRRIATVNLSLCFSSKTRISIGFFLFRVFVNAIYGVFESLLAWFSPAELLKMIIVDETSDDVSNGVLKSGGCLLICPHYSCLELVAPGLSFATTRLVMSYRPHENSWLESIIYNGRLKFGSLVNAKDIRGLVRILRTGGHVWFGPDQDMGKQGSVFVDFFGVPACTVTTPSRLSKLTGCPVFFVTFSRRFLLYRLEVIPFPLEYPTDDEAKNASIMNRFIERSLENDLSQYMWLHRRFKTQPDAPRYSLYSSTR